MFIAQCSTPSSLPVTQAAADAAVVRVEAPVVPFRSGIHACRLADLPLWLGRDLYVVELDGQMIEERPRSLRHVRDFGGGSPLGRRGAKHIHARLRRPRPSARP